MGPKNISLILNDPPRKDMSLMDRMCLKLESICLEVDKNPSVIFQEASKYVENQMSTVGSNVRKLCAEICDLLPPRALDAPDGAGAYVSLGDKLVEPEKELHQCKEVQSGSRLQHPPVNGEGNDKIILGSCLSKSRDGLNTGVNKLKLLGMEDRQSLTSGVKSQQANENETLLGIPVRCKRESFSETSKELVRTVHALSKDTSSPFNHGSLPALQEIKQDLEQYAYWYVDSDYREALMRRILETASSMRPIENNQRGGVFDEFDSDWELL